LVATVKKNGRRLILVLNGLNSSKERAREATRLIKLGFNQYESLKIAEENTNLKRLFVWAGSKKSVDVYNKDEISITIPKRIKKDISFYVKYQTPVIPPISKDQIIGEFVIKNKKNEILKKVELFARDEVKKMNFFQKIGHNFKYLLLGESAFSK